MRRHPAPFWAIETLLRSRAVATSPLHGQIAAVSVGFFRGQPVLDLDYAEDAAAETDDVVENAIAKRRRKGADWIIANDVSGDVMGGDRNRIHLISEAGNEAPLVEEWPEMTKTEVGARLAARIAEKLKGAA